MESNFIVRTKINVLKFRKFTSFRATACSAECQQLLSKEEESHKDLESLHPSTLMADPSEPHESSASAESHGFESTYTAHVNELESFLHSIEESEEHDSKQTNVAPSGIDDTER